MEGKVDFSEAYNRYVTSLKTGCVTLNSIIPYSNLFQKQISSLASKLKTEPTTEISTYKNAYLGTLS